VVDSASKLSVYCQLKKWGNYPWEKLTFATESMTENEEDRESE